MKFESHYYKTSNLTPDERNAMRKNQRGVWLCAGIFNTRAEALNAARECNHEKVRARKAH